MLASPDYCVGCSKATETEIDTKNNVVIGLRTKPPSQDSTNKIDCLEDCEWTETEILHDRIRKLRRSIVSVKEAKTSRSEIYVTRRCVWANG